MGDPESEDPDLWERHADWWQEEFTDGADPEYVEQIIPLVLEHLAGLVQSRSGQPGPGRSTPVVLDIGTGEGHVARAIGSQLDVHVIGLDPTWAQLTVARQRGGPVRYVRGGSSGLPVGDASIDAVVVSLVLEHVDDVDTAIGEISRVLRPGGRLVLLLNHPLLQTPSSGMIVDHVLDPPETYWRIGPYLPEPLADDTGTGQHVSYEEVQKNVFIRFVHRPLSRYVNGLIDAGLDLVHMDEPSPPPGFIAQATEYEHTIVAATPRLLSLVAVRRVDTLEGA